MERFDPHTAAAEIDLDAYQNNLRAFAELVGPECTVMAIVKADAYGHGMIECARAARRTGIEWLGAATLGEAYALRAAGDQGRIFSWVYGVAEDLTPAIAADIDFGIHGAAQLTRAAAAATEVGRPARIHLKIDTGLSRNGCPPADWPELCAAARAAQDAGAVEVVAVWSHFAASEDPDAEITPHQIEVFDRAFDQARAAGLDPIRHFANTAAALRLPQARHEMVRIGIGSYGIDPDDADVAARAGVRLEPVMKLRAGLTNVKVVAAGESVSYGATWTASEQTTLGLVPMGYADGIPRHASNRGQVVVNGRRCPIRGRICMDQFVVELGPGATEQIGDEVVFFGPAAVGLTASDWARACQTIGYEIVTRIGAGVPRVHTGAAKEA